MSAGVCENSSTTNTVARMKTRRELTPEELAESARLKAIYENRKAAAKARGSSLTQADVAEQCGWSGQSAFSQYATGKIPLNLDALLVLSRVLDFAVEEVSPRLAKELAAAGIESFRTNRTASGSNVQMALQHRDSYEYPIISWVMAGAWEEAIEPWPPGFADRYELTNYKAKGSAFWLEVKGDSMTAPMGQTFLEGTLILVDTQVEPTPGRYVVAKLTDSNEATFKKLVEDNGQRYLKPLNPAYPMIKIDGNCKIVGVAVETKQKI